MRVETILNLEFILKMRLKFNKPSCFGGGDRGQTYNPNFCVVCDFFDECTKTVTSRGNRDMYDELFDIFH